MTAGFYTAGCGGARRRGSVVVVGAGLAGLVAAYELDRAGFLVTVLEARARVGGRVYTLRAPFEERQHAEGGGEFIDTSHTRLLGYARTLGLKLEDAQAGPDLDAVVYLDGRRRLESDLYTDAVTAEIDRLDARADALSHSIDPSDPLRRGAAFDNRSLAELMDEVGLSGIARTLAEHSMRDEYGVEPADLSLLFHLQLSALTRDLADTDIERYRIRGGNDQVPAALAEELGDRVRVSAPATRVSRHADGVRVTAAGDEPVEADWCVLAVPLPALREVEFAPALPPALSRAIASFQYGAVTKTPVQYSERFWVKQGFTGATVTDLPIGTTWEATVSQPGEPGILIAYASDGSAPPVGAAAEQIDQVYPGSAQLALGGTTVDWPHEPYSGGSYSAPAPGQMTRYLEALRSPAGRIVLAGEHTDTVASYMEGAVRSGRRAAALIERLA